MAASAVAFQVVSFLFDVSSFPHTPYIMMSLAGLLAAVVAGSKERPEAPRVFDGQLVQTSAEIPSSRARERDPEVPVAGPR